MLGGGSNVVDRRRGLPRPRGPGRHPGRHRRGRPGRPGRRGPAGRRGRGELGRRGRPTAWPRAWPGWMPVRHPRPGRRHPDPERRRLRPGSGRHDHLGPSPTTATRAAMAEIPAADCGFGYRTSRFKRPTGRHVVLAVHASGWPRARCPAPVRYPDLATELGVTPGDRVPLQEARSAVLKLRAAQGHGAGRRRPGHPQRGLVLHQPDPERGRSSSVLDRGHDRRAGAACRTTRPGDGQVKVPAAWLIEQAGFGKGHAGPGPAPARISGKHTLALVNPGRQHRRPAGAGPRDPGRASGPRSGSAWTSSRCSSGPFPVLTRVLRPD